MTQTTDLTKERISEIHQRVVVEGCALRNQDLTSICHMAHKYLELRGAIDEAGI